jgi:hypothetical protein
METIAQINICMPSASKLQTTFTIYKNFTEEKKELGIFSQCRMFWEVCSYNWGCSRCNSKSTVTCRIVWSVSFDLSCTHECIMYITLYRNIASIFRKKKAKWYDRVSFPRFSRKTNGSQEKKITSVIRRTTSSLLRCLPSNRGARSRASIRQNSGDRIVILSKERSGIGNVFNLGLGLTRMLSVLER